MDTIINKVMEIAEKLAPEFDAEIVEVTYKNTEMGKTLTIYIYKNTGIGLDELEAFSKAIDPILEKLDPTDGEPYNLNISSPGLDRKMKTLRDYERNLGKNIVIKLKNGSEFTGKLSSISEDEKTKIITVTIEDKKKGNIIVSGSEISSATLEIKF